MRFLNRVSVAALVGVCTLGGAASAQVAVFTSIPTLTYQLPGGASILGGQATSVAAQMVLQQGLPEMAANLTIVTIQQLQQTNRKYFAPMSEMSLGLDTAIRYSNATSAAMIAKQITDKWNAFQSSGDKSKIDIGFYYGNQPQIKHAFDDYVSNVAQAVQSAQGAAAYINSYLKANDAGIKLLTAAFNFQGSKYQRGMQCSDLFADSLRSLGFSAPSYPFCVGCRPTLTWFRYGLGPAFQQILGGPSGMTLRQLADGDLAGTLPTQLGGVPIGAVIVSDHHVALYDGIDNTGSTPRIITFDANDSKGWLTSVITGSAMPNRTSNGDGFVNLVFAGHQVGEHITRLQWADSAKVKVFKFIGNPLSPEPRVTIANAVNGQCGQNVQLATQLKATACARDQTATACKDAAMHLEQAAQQCAVPMH